MSRLTRDGTTELVLRDIFSGRTGTRIFSFSCSADHEQEWQPYPVDSNSAIICVMTTHEDKLLNRSGPYRSVLIYMMDRFSGSVQH